MSVSKESSDPLDETKGYVASLKQISRNTLFLVIGQLVSKIISFGYFLVLTRCFTVSEFGDLSLVLSLLMLAYAVSESGLTRLVIREISRDEKQLQSYYSLLIPLKVVLCLLTYGVLSIVAWASYRPEVLHLIIIGGLSLLPLGLAGLFNAFLHAHQLMKFSAIGEILLSVSQAALGLVALSIKISPDIILITYCLSSLVYMVFLAHRVHCLGCHLLLVCDFPKMLRLFVNALPYAGIGILMMLSLRAETLILGWFSTSKEIGLYSVAIKFSEAAIFLPIMLASSISPVLAKVHDESTLKLRAVYLWAMHRLVQWLLPFSIAVIIASDKIITLLFTPEYINAAAILKIVFVAFPFLSLQMLNSSILLTSSYPRNTLVLYAGTSIIQFILGWILVTRWGANGAALSFLGSHVITFLVSNHYIRKWFMQEGGSLLNILSPVTAGLVMSLVIFIGRDSLEIWIVPVALAVYAACIAVLPKSRFTQNYLATDQIR